VTVYVTTLEDTVDVGAIADTTPLAVIPDGSAASVTAGKVSTAAWPTLTAAMSASAIEAVTVSFEISEIVAKPEELDDELELAVLVEDAEPDPLLEAPEEPAPTVDPTVPFNAVITPPTGAVRVQAAKFASSVATVWVSVVMLELLPPLPEPTPSRAWFSWV
jgi:hypothetical protein